MNSKELLSAKHLRSRNMKLEKRPYKKPPSYSMYHIFEDGKLTFMDHFETRKAATAFVKGYEYGLYRFPRFREEMVYE